MRKNFRNFSIAVSASLLLFAAPAIAQAPIEWKYYTFNQVNDSITKTHRAFAEDVLKATNGRLKIVVYGAAELPYSPPGVLRAVAADQIQMGDMAFGFSAGDVPELNVLSLPFLCSSYEQFKKAVPLLSKLAEEVLQKKFGISALLHFSPPPQNLWLNRPMKSFDDFKGLKVRTWNPSQVAMVRQFGGSPVTLDPKDVVPALERRTVDAAITGSLSANDWRAYSIVKYGYLLNISMGHMAMTVNNSQLQKLPPDVRQTLLEKAAEWRPKYMEMSESGDKAALQNMRSNGVTITEPTAEEYRSAQAAVQPIWDAWAQANGDTGKALLQSAQAACK